MSLRLYFIDLQPGQHVQIYSDLPNVVDSISIGYDDSRIVQKILEKVNVDCTGYQKLFDLGIRQDFVWTSNDLNYLIQFTEQALQKLTDNSEKLSSITVGRTIETEFEFARDFLNLINSICKQAVRHNLTIGFNQ